jgi:hypothetical protein
MLAILPRCSDSITWPNTFRITLSRMHHWLHFTTERFTAQVGRVLPISRPFYSLWRCRFWLFRVGALCFNGTSKYSLCRPRADLDGGLWPGCFGARLSQSTQAKSLAAERRRIVIRNFERQSVLWLLCLSSAFAIEKITANRPSTATAQTSHCGSRSGS